MIATLGLPVQSVPGIRESDHCFELLESGKINYIIYTGALLDSTMEDYIALHRKALQPEHRLPHVAGHRPGAGRHHA